MSVVRGNKRVSLSIIEYELFGSSFTTKMCSKWNIHVSYSLPCACIKMWTSKTIFVQNTRVNMQKALCSSNSIKCLKFRCARVLL